MSTITRVTSTNPYGLYERTVRHDEGNHMSETHRREHGGGHSAIGGLPEGLAISAKGYTLEAAPRMFGAGQEEMFEVRILDPSGRAVRDLDEQHEARMHLIVARRDLIHYQHLHPSVGEDGTWSVPLTLPEPGVYRAFADFAIGGEPLTLGIDLSVPGYYEPRPLSTPTGLVCIDGYEVALDAEITTTSAEGMLVFRVAHGGREVVDLEPYLGALGHLVILREGDLAYLHVHPVDPSETDDTDGGQKIMFHARFPSIGRYRLFLQFAHGGRVHTAAFTAAISP